MSDDRERAERAEAEVERLRALVAQLSEQNEALRLRAHDADHERNLAMSQGARLFVLAEERRKVMALREAEVARLRTENARMADTIGAVGRKVGAESCDRDALLAAVADAIEAAKAEVSR